MPDKSTFKNLIPVKGSKAQLRIHRMAYGGYVVFDDRAIGFDRGEYCVPLYACTKMIEALSFIETTMKVEK